MLIALVCVRCLVKNFLGPPGKNAIFFQIKSQIIIKKVCTFNEYMK